MPNELKPCPFCGSRYLSMSKGASWIDKKYQGRIRAIVCGDCGAFGGVFNTLALSNEVAEKRAVESWNRRAAAKNE